MEFLGRHSNQQFILIIIMSMTYSKATHFSIQSYVTLLVIIFVKKSILHTIHFNAHVMEHITNILK